MEMRIAGGDSQGVGGGRIPVINPATGALLDTVPSGTEEDASAAIDAADDARGSWAAQTLRDRGKILMEAARRVRSVHQEIAHTLVMEEGKPLYEAIDEIRGFCNILEFFSAVSGVPQGDSLHLGSSGDCMVLHEPLGVCSAIIPWNVPAILMGWKCGPSLLAGNTLVLKPASAAPLTVIRLAQEMEAAGLPPGVLNVITGQGSVAGEAIVRHPRVRKVSFTGDSETGRRIREVSAAHPKEVSLELGGSDPMIVWHDADISRVVQGAMRGRFYNCGQACTAVKRLIVHEDVAGQVISALAEAIRELRPGDGLVPGTDLGPLISEGQRQRLSDQVRRSLKDGEGKIFAQGSVPEKDQYSNGFFYPPMLVTGVPPDSPLMQEETFGPVLPVTEVSTLDEALSVANNSRYGLGASVWTHDTRVVHTVFSCVEAGVVWVNRHLTVLPEVPFGGVKESGIGRENGIQAINNWTRTKSLIISW